MILLQASSLKKSISFVNFGQTQTEKMLLSTESS